MRIDTVPLQPYRRRLTTIAFLRIAVLAAPIAALAAAAAGASIRGTVLAAGGGLIAAAVAAIVRAPTVREAAAAIDSRLGLPDRLAAAVEFAGSAHPIDRLIVEGAVRHLDGVAPEKIFPVQPGRGAAAGAVVAMMAVVLAAWNGSQPGIEEGRSASGFSTGSSSQPGAPAGMAAAGQDASGMPEASRERVPLTADADTPDAAPDDAQPLRASTPDGEQAGSDRPGDRQPAGSAVPRQAQSSGGTPLPDGAEDLAGSNRQAVRDAGGGAGSRTGATFEGALARSPAGAGAAAAAAPGAAADAAGGVRGGQLQEQGASTFQGAARAPAVSPGRELRSPGDVEAALLRHDVPPRLRAYVRRYLTRIQQAGRQ